MRVCKEWGSLLLNEEVKVVCDEQKATDWIGKYFSITGFMAQAQDTVVRAFGLGTGAWALWLDLDRKKVRIRHYDARMVIPLTWDEDGVTECTFVTRAFYRGKAVDQLQMHLKGGAGFSAGSSSPSTSSPSPEHADALLAMNDEESYKIVTVCFDKDGNELAPVGIAPVFDTGCAFPTFGIVKPAVTNTRVDMSPYGQSVFADAVDAVQAVDLTFDALINEVDVSKMRVFLSDVLFDREKTGDKAISIPFGKQDCKLPKGDVDRGHDPGVRACAAHLFAKRGIPHSSPDARGSLRLRAGIFRLRRVAWVRPHGHRGVLRQLRPDGQYPKT